MIDTMHIDTQTKADQIYQAFCDGGYYADVCDALGIDCVWTLAEGDGCVQCARLTRFVGSPDNRFALSLSFPNGFEYRVSGTVIRPYDDAQLYAIDAVGDPLMSSLDRFELVAYATAHAAAHFHHGERRPDWLRCFREIA